MPDLTYSPAAKTRTSEIATLLADAFHSEQETCLRWVEEAGLEHFRSVELGGELVGGALLLPGAQWFLGRAVPMTGIAGVAVAPTARGGGVAKTMMSEVLAELRRQGVATSVLYASTTGLYRRVGYGAAGSRCCYRVPLKALQRRGGAHQVRLETAEQQQVVEALQADHRKQHGALVRSPYHWRRARTPKGQETRGYTFWRGDRLVANCRYLKRRSPEGEIDLELTDLFAVDAEAAQEVLAFLSSQQSLCRQALWFGGPSNPWIAYLPDRVYNAEIQEEWMLRLVDLPSALEKRGYPRSLSGTLEFSVNDSVLSQNSGSWRLEVNQGEARCRPGTKLGTNPKLVIDIGTLSGLYTGHYTAAHAQLTGGVQGSPDDLALLDDLFVAPAPDLPDFF